MAAAGTSEKQRQYACRDNLAQLNAKDVYCRFQRVDLDVSVSYSPVQSIRLDSKEDYLVLSPNPANTTVQIQLAKEFTGPIQLSLYNLQGQILKSINQELAQGAILAEYWDLSDLSSGLYFVEISGLNYKERKKLQVIR